MIVLTPLDAETTAIIDRMQAQFRSEAGSHVSAAIGFLETTSSVAVVLDRDRSKDEMRIPRKLTPTAPRKPTSWDEDLKDCILNFDVDSTLWDGEDVEKPFPAVRTMIRALYEFGFPLAVATFNITADVDLLEPWDIMKYFSGFSCSFKGGKPRSVEHLQGLINKHSVAVLFDDCWINEQDFTEDDHPQRHMIRVDPTCGVTVPDIMRGIEASMIRLGKQEIYLDMWSDLSQSLNRACLIEHTASAYKRARSM